MIDDPTLYDFYEAVDHFADYIGHELRRT